MVPSLTLIQPGSGKSVNYQGPFSVDLAFTRWNSPLLVSGRCVIECCCFGNLPKTVRHHYYTYKARETGRLRTHLPSHSRRPACAQVVCNNSKTSWKWGGRRASTATELLTKNFIMDVKTSFFYVSSEVQKDLQDISAGIDQFFNTQLIKILSGI